MEKIIVTGKCEVCGFEANGECNYILCTLQGHYDRVHKKQADLQAFL